MNFQNILDNMVEDPKKRKLDSSAVEFFLSENRKNHFTTEFEDISLLIARRGFPIKFKTVSNLEAIKCTYNTGATKPKYSGNNIIKKIATEVNLTPNKPNLGGWKLESNDDGSYRVVSPSNCAVGRWNFQVATQGQKLDHEVIILFNPFCEQDQVYLENDKEREEYILSDSGLVFGASSWRLKAEGWGWVFGQFESKVIDCCIHLLEKSSLTATSKSSPVFVSRAMTAMVNSLDDDGVLVGNWSGDYSDGVDPSEWANSADILVQYLETKKPVKYGQCWVFSGVLVAVLRTLGIPCRSVTNYRSAHDTENNMVIDIFHDKKGNKIESDDSVWNFHLWNEIWTKRSDLPKGFDGWQALDATPQEMSDGAFQAGPAPLKAIKEGRVYLPYDARFIFAEVNADRVYWRENDDGDFVIKKIDKKHVGRMVVTKAVGSNEPHYITDEYKHKEGSWEERYQTRLAVTYGSEPDIYENIEDEDEIHMKFHCNHDYYVIGDPVEFSIDLELLKLESASVTLNVSASLYGYNGKFISNVFSENKDLKLPEEKLYKCNIESSKYAKGAISGSVLKISAMYDLHETKDMGFLEEEVPIRAPPPTVTVLNKPPFIVNESLQLKFSFKNQFAGPLTGGYFRLNAPGFSSRKSLEIEEKSLNPGEECSYVVDYKPRRTGEVNLVVSFSSDQHRGLHAYKHIQVQYGGEPM